MDRLFVVDTFHACKLKRGLCNIMGIAGGDVICDQVWYRAMTPVRFAKHVLLRYKNSALEEELISFLRATAVWLISFRGKISKAAFNKCVEFLVLYAELLVGHRPGAFEGVLGHREILDALNDKEQETGEVLLFTLEAEAIADRKMFDYCVMLIVNKCIHAPTVNRCKNVIRWHERVKRGDNLCFLDAEFVSLETLLRVQRTYEEINYLKFPLDDISTSGSLCQTMLNMGLNNTIYNYSEIVVRGVGEISWAKNCVTVHAEYKGTEYTLILHNGKRVPAPRFRYEGLLEVMTLRDVEEGRCFVMKQLGHATLCHEVFIEDEIKSTFNRDIETLNVGQVLAKLNNLRDLNFKDTLNKKPEEEEELELPPPPREFAKLKQPHPDDYEFNQLIKQKESIEYLLCLSTRINTLRHSKS